MYVLNLNYRSTKNILKVANHLIKNNSDRIDKELITDNHQGETIVVYTGDTSQLEASYIAREIQKMIKNKVYAYHEIVVLYRARHLSRALEQEFINNGIPYYVYGDIRFYQRREIKDLIAYLKLLVKPDDELSLKRIINVPTRSIGATTVEKISQYASSHSLKFYDVLLQIANNEIEAE
jgi:DNA helicase-2/ATP-dependent DNA helicase PcrA